MAHRPNVWGVEFKSVSEKLGSKDQNLVKSLVKHLHDWIEPKDEKFKKWRDQAELVLARAVNEGIPFKDCSIESYAEVWSAVTIVEHIVADKMRQTDFGHWHTSALFQVDEQLGKRLDNHSRKCLKYMCSGRPIFGRKIETDWSFYACIKLDELIEFRSGLEKMYAQCCEIIDKGYMNEQDFDTGLMPLVESLMETQDELIENRLDFWLYGN